MSSLRPWTQARLAESICVGLAIIATSLRLYFRITRNRLWTDDYVAIGSALCSVVHLSIVFVSPYQSDFGVARFYLLIILYYTILWSARLSAIFSIIRIVRATTQRVRHLFWIVALFVFFWVLLTIQIFWECEPHKDWKYQTIPRCNFSEAVPACHIISDVSGDAILLLVPIRLFTAIREKKLRTRLILIFGISVMTTFGSIPHLAVVFNQKALLPNIIAGVVETSISLLVCNFPVLFTAIFKLQGQADPPTSPDDIVDFQTNTTFEGPVPAATLANDTCITKSSSGIIPVEVA